MSYDPIYITIDKVGLLNRVDSFLTAFLTDSNSAAAQRYRGDLANYIESLGFQHVTRSQIAKTISDSLTINDKSTKAGYKLRSNDHIKIDLESISKILEKNRDEKSGLIKSEAGSLKILDETEDYLVINKPKGIVVHPGAGNLKGTLANYVRGYLESKGEYDPELERAGIVHRLDKDVSGIMVVAKNRDFQLQLKKQFEEHQVGKVYIAVVESLDHLSRELPLNQWIELEGFIARKSSNRKLMEFYERSQGRSDERIAKSRVKNLGNKRVLINIITGRKHQIRATLKYIGLRIDGDKSYGAKSALNSGGIELECIGLIFKNRVGEIKEYFTDPELFTMLWDLVLEGKILSSRWSEKL